MTTTATPTKTQRDSAAVLAAAHQRRIQRIENGVTLGETGQAITLGKGKARTPKAPADRKAPTPRITDEALTTLIRDLKAANPKATASSMIGLVRAAGHKCNGGRIRTTFWEATGQAKGRTASTKAERDEAKASADAAARTARAEAAKAEKKTLAAWTKGGEQGDRPATPTLDAMRDEYEAKEAAKRPVTPEPAAKAPKAPRTRKAGDPPADAPAKPKLVTPLPKGTAKSTTKKGGSKAA